MLKIPPNRLVLRTQLLLAGCLAGLLSVSPIVQADSYTIDTTTLLVNGGYTVDGDDTLTIEENGFIDSFGGRGVSATGANNVIVNDGVIRSELFIGNYDSISVEGDNTTVINNGTIRVIPGPGSYSGDGIRVIGDQAAIDSSGEIIANVASTEAGIMVAGDDAQIEHSGSISVGYVFGYGMYVTGNSAVINHSGILEGDGASATGIHILGDDTTLTISGEVSIANSDAIVIDGLDNTLNISGMVTGDISSLQPGTTTMNLLDGASISGDTPDMPGTGTVNGNVLVTSSGGFGADQLDINSGGTLILNGVLTGITSIHAGGVLGGDLTAQDVNVTGGMIAPGNSIGTINVTGDIDFSGGGIYAVEIDANGNSDLINATGTATLTGGSVQVLPMAGDYSGGTNYTILTAAGGVSGTFNPPGLAFYDSTLSYDANNVYLGLAVNFESISSLTPNQSAVAGVLSSAYSQNQASLQTLISSLLPLDIVNGQQALDSLSGYQHSMNPALSNARLRRLMHLIRKQHFGQSRDNDVSLIDTFSPASGLSAGDTQRTHRHWWISGFAGDGDIDDTHSVQGISYRDSGIALGVDIPWGNDWLVGLAGSYSNSDIRGSGSDSDVESYQLAAYGRWQRDDWYADVQAGVAWHDTDTDRTILIGSTSSHAAADYDSNTLGAAIEAGKDFQLGNGATVTPYASLEYLRTEREHFTESGSNANLSVDDEAVESLRTSLGARLSKSYQAASGHRYTPSAYVAYVYEHGDTDNSMRTAFSAAPASGFAIEGVNMDRDRLQLGLGLTVNTDDDTQFRIGYDGEFSGSDDYHSLSATFTMRW